MIKSNELRICNVYNRKHGKGWTETIIDEMLMAEIFGQSMEYALDDFEPIPLTEEWFLRLGFTFKTEELGVKFYETQVGIDFLCFSKNGHWNINSGKSHWYMDRNFQSPKYVHQLQNLYYDLTGVELSVS